VRAFVDWLYAMDETCMLHGIGVSDYHKQHTYLLVAEL